MAACTPCNQRKYWKGFTVDPDGEAAGPSKLIWNRQDKNFECFVCPPPDVVHQRIANCVLGGNTFILASPRPISFAEIKSSGMKTVPRVDVYIARLFPPVYENVETGAVLSEKEYAEIDVIPPFSLQSIRGMSAEALLSLIAKCDHDPAKVQQILDFMDEDQQMAYAIHVSESGPPVNSGYDRIEKVLVVDKSSNDDIAIVTTVTLPTAPVVPWQEGSVASLFNVSAASRHALELGFRPGSSRLIHTAHPPGDEMMKRQLHTPDELNHPMFKSPRFGRVDLLGIVADISPVQGKQTVYLTDCTGKSFVALRVANGLKANGLEEIVVPGKVLVFQNLIYERPCHHGILFLTFRIAVRVLEPEAAGAVAPLMDAAKRIRVKSVVMLRSILGPIQAAKPDKKRRGSADKAAKRAKNSRSSQIFEKLKELKSTTLDFSPSSALTWCASVLLDIDQTPFQKTIGELDHDRYMASIHGDDVPAVAQLMVVEMKHVMSRPGNVFRSRFFDSTGDVAALLDGELVEIIRSYAGGRCSLLLTNVPVIHHQISSQLAVGVGNLAAFAYRSDTEEAAEDEQIINFNGITIVKI